MRPPLSRSPVPVLLALTCWLLLPTLLAPALVPNIGSRVGSLAFALWIFALPLVVLGGARKLFLFWLPAGLLAPLQAYLIYFFHSVPGDAVTASALSVSLAQMIELLTGFGWLPLLLPLCWALYIMLLRRIDPRLALSVEARKALAAALLMYAMLGLYNQQMLAHIVHLPPWFEESLTATTYPASVVRSLASVLDGRWRTPRQTGALHASAPKTPLVVILVIGESVRADHLRLNGYARNTTPELGQSGAALLTFSDVASTANYTYAAVPNIVSGEIGAHTVTLVSLFHQAGFRTAWFSNQDSGLFQPHADISNFSDTEWYQGFRQDTEMLPLLAACMKQCGERQLIVLHMYGSHFPYDARYLSRDRVFKPVFSDAGFPTAAPRFKRELINSYDNTLLAADRFLASVIAQAQAAEKPAIMLFTSDHGENLYDDERQLFMHLGAQPTRADIMVPMLLWANQAYRTAQPAKMAALSARRATPISHRAIMPTLLDLADISYAGKDPARSLASDAFRPVPRAAQAATGLTVDVATLR